MIGLAKQIELLAQLSVQYQERLESQDENWKIFFNQNNVGVPMATLIYLKMVEDFHRTHNLNFNQRC